MLLVPVALRGHAHDQSHAGNLPERLCAVCTLAHHTPVLTPHPVTSQTPAIAVFAVHEASTVAPIARSVARPTGRGPPPVLSLTAVV